MKTEKWEAEEIIDWFNANPGSIGYSALVDRPGVHAWLVEVEYTKFKPDTEANEDFHLFFSKFPPDDPNPLFVVTAAMHRSAQKFAESILWRNGLRKCRAGYVPVMIDGRGVQPFFLQHPNVFYLENHSEGGQNVIYANDPAKSAIAWEHEKQQAQRFFDEHAAWLKTPEGKAIADAFWAKHPKGHVF